MKTFKFIITILSCMFCVSINAQTTYKGVTIDRDHQDNRCVVVKNANNYPVDIMFQYKIGSRNEAWRDFSDNYVYIEANQTKVFSVGSKIYGLNLIYVDILKPSIGEQILNFFSESTGGDSRQNSSYNTNNGYSGSNGSSYNSNITGLNCYKCGGSGKINGETCSECGGSGKQTKPVPFPEPEKKY